MSDRPRWLTESARSGGTDVDGDERPAKPEPHRPVAGERRASDRRRLSWRKRSAAPVVGRAPSGARSSGARSSGARSSGARSSTVRFERRAAEVRRRPWLFVGIVAGVLAVVGALVWLVGFSPVLACRTVTVTGLADPAEQQAVADAAAIALDTPLVRVDTAAATERVQHIPTVALATVSRSWPTTMVVTVQRKVPVLAVRNPQRQLQVVDATGVAYETVLALPPGVAEVNATAQAPDPEGIRAAISILALLPDAQRATVSGVTVTSADLVILQLGPVSVVWGGLADGPKKLTVLQALLPTGAAVIDVSAPDTPVTR